MKKLTRRPVFWIAHSLFFLICLLFTWRNFYQAFPFVELDVKMDRPAALKAATELSKNRGWNLPERQAASFDMDSATQNFIELEAGGPAALSKVLKEEHYFPYLWRVRQFAEGQTNERHIRFTPQGKPYGFWEKISEDDPGAALNTEQARLIAEKTAASQWGIDFAPFHMAEQSHEIRRSKRVDHSFIYEREKERIGQGRYRMKLVVSGDHLSELSHSIKVPDEFSRRYTAMRSANGTIASLALAAVTLLYGLLACGVGLFFLARSGWIAWRMPLIVAGGIAGLHFFEELNQLPLAWMNYDTAISTQAFILRHFADALVGSLFELVILFIPILAAESLSRRAFPNQPQLWKVFSRDAAASKSILGRVLGAYLMVGFHFAFVIWMYQIGSKHLGWWNPSEVLFHPDALAEYFPWLTSISNSLHAGIWEECLFRAIPLASAALIGTRYGHRRKWLLGAFLLQAVIFGAGHASYPTQPSYARVIELIVPSFTFGGAYLLFGLLPGIIMHYTYDVALFAMPLFLSSGTQAAVSRSIVIAVSLLPLLIVLVARARAGAWGELPERFFNRAWRPVGDSGSQGEGSSEMDGANPVGASTRIPVVRFSPRMRQGVFVAGIVGLAVWAGAVEFKTDAPGLQVDRETAIGVARKTLEQRGVKLSSDWQALAQAEASPDEEDLFVWKTSGAATYRTLMGTYLQPALWKVRFARFEGDLQERAEEYQVFLAGPGTVFRVRHELPEGRAGARLSEDAARVIANRVVHDDYRLDPTKLRQISSKDYELPQRKDWLFVWADPAQTLSQGEARVAVKISGDLVAGERRYIDIPEEWLRKERGRKTAMGVIATLSMVLLVIAGLWVTLWAVREWVKGAFSVTAASKSLSLFAVIAALGAWNSFPAAMASFSTSQPLSNQLLRFAVRTLVTVIVFSIVPAVWVGCLHAHARAAARENGGHATAWLGYAVGGVLAAISGIASRIGHETAPLWPQVSGASGYFPVWSGFEGLSGYLMGGASLGLTFFWAERRFRSRISRTAFFVVIGLALAALRVEESPWIWLSSGMAAGVVLAGLAEFLHRTSSLLVLPALGLLSILARFRVLAVPGFPGSRAASVIGILVVAAASWVWFGILNGSKSESR